MDQTNLIKAIRNAIRQGDINGVKAIIESYPESLKAITAFGTWLHVAASMGQIDILKYLIQSGLDPNTEAGTFNAGAINRAAREGHYNIVEYLISCGAKLDTSEPDRNPMFAAIYGGHKDVVQLLIDNGINSAIRYTGEFMHNMDAYDFAVERGQTEIAEMLKPYRK